MDGSNTAAVLYKINAAWLLLLLHAADAVAKTTMIILLTIAIRLIY